jgi:hypothetical protein
MLTVMRRVVVLILLVTAPATALGATPVSEQDSRAMSDARLMVTFVEGCYAYKEDYRQCRTSRDLLLFGSGVSYVAPPKKPGRGQVTAVAKSKETYVVLSVSRTGNRYYVTKTSAGSLKRTCRERVNSPTCRGGRW